MVLSFLCPFFFETLTFLSKKTGFCDYYDNSFASLIKFLSPPQSTTTNIPQIIENIEKTTKIAVNYPNSESIVYDFQETEPLNNCLLKIFEKMGDKPFSLQFNRSKLSIAQQNQTFLELGMVPSASIFVFEEKSPEISTQTSAISQNFIISSFLKLFLLLKTYALLIFAFFFGNSPNSNLNQDERSNLIPKQQQDPSPAKKKPASKFRKDGNVVRFGENQDEDDEDENDSKDNKGYNGNGTEFKWK